MDEMTSPTGKNSSSDYKQSRKGSTGSNNLLKPDSKLWSASINDIESIKTKSQSLSNIAGK